MTCDWSIHIVYLFLVYLTFWIILCAYHQVPQIFTFPLVSHCHGHTQVLKATWSMICPSANDIVPQATIVVLHNSSLRLDPGSDQLKATPEKHPALLLEGTHQFISSHWGHHHIRVVMRLHNSSNSCWAGLSAATGRKRFSCLPLMSSSVSFICQIRPPICTFPHPLTVFWRPHWLQAQQHMIENSLRYVLHFI